MINLKLSPILDKMPAIHIRMLVEKDGIILSDRTEIGHSWVRNAWNFAVGSSLDIGYFGATPAAGESYFAPGRLFYKNTLGVPVGPAVFARHSPAALLGCGFQNNGTNETYGILIGTGNDAFHIDDTYLANVIAHGNVTDTLYYQAQIAPVVTYNGHPDHTFTTTISRKYNNNSGASITVAEVGLVYYGYYQALLFSRDVIDTPTEVVNGAQLSVSISITSISISAIEDGFVRPAIGTAGSGGYYAGQIYYTRSEQIPAAHDKYCMIISPISGGESGNLAFRNPASGTDTGTGGYYSKACSDVLVSEGAGSPIGEFCAAANAATLGGFTDWYIPGYGEYVHLFAINASLPAPQRLVSAGNIYWSSNKFDATHAYCVRLSDSYYGPTSQTSAYPVRLIRRALLADWSTESPSPSRSPSASPSNSPSLSPSNSPSASPSASPSNSPSASPST